MRFINKKQREIDYKNYKMRSASTADYHELITEPVTIMHEGEVKVVYDKLPFDATKYREALERIKYTTNTRTNGLVTTSRIFGYSPRVALRKDFCAATALATEYPEEHDLICELGQKVAGIYLKRATDVYKNHTQETKDRMSEDWVIPGTPFTSGIINKNNPLKYHFDTGNFKKVFSCMIAFKHDVSGGIYHYQNMIADWRLRTVLSCYLMVRRSYTASHLSKSTQMRHIAIPRFIIRYGACGSVSR